MGIEKGNTVLKDIEAAIQTRNFSRMSEIGNNVILLAKDDRAWLDAVLNICGYLIKSNGHLWDALHLNKQAAVMAPENTELQNDALKALANNIKAFPKVEERVKAAHTVVVYAPKGSTVLVVSINLMLDNVLGLPNGADRRRFTLVAMHHAPENSTVQIKARAFLKREETLLLKASNANVAAKAKADGNQRTLLDTLNKQKVSPMSIPPKKTGPQDMAASPPAKKDD